MIGKHVWHTTEDSMVSHAQCETRGAHQHAYKIALCLCMSKWTPVCACVCMCMCVCVCVAQALHKLGCSLAVETDNGQTVLQLAKGEPVK